MSSGRGRTCGLVLAVLMVVALAGCASRAIPPTSDLSSAATATASAITPPPTSPSPTANAAVTVSPARASPPTAADEQLVRDLTAFARAPTATTLMAVPLADRVGLGLAAQITTTRTSGELLLPSAWVLLPTGPFRGRTGAWSALELLRASGATTVTVGPHPHCASPAVPAPAGFSAHRRVSVQPTDTDTCLRWWTVDLFVATSGRIEAVTLDLWEP